MKAQTQSEYAIVEERLSKQFSPFFSHGYDHDTNQSGWSGTKIKDCIRTTMSVSSFCDLNRNVKRQRQVLTREKS